jgi:hypothetical protein
MGRLPIERPWRSREPTLANRRIGQLLPPHWIPAGDYQASRVGPAGVSGPLVSLFLVLLLIVMPLEGEEHRCDQHDNLQRKEDDRKPIDPVARHWPIPFGN